MRIGLKNLPKKVLNKWHELFASDEKDNYRHGFNGMEKDNELKGIGNSLDFGARIYDSRLGKFLSIDPLASKFPSESNYIFAGNSPIYLLDEKGEKKTTYFTITDERSGKTTKITTVTPGLLARSYKRMHSEIRTYDWFDYEQKVNVNISKEGKRSVSISAPTQGAYRTSTFFKNSWGALEDAGEHRVKDNRSFGGWIGTSSSGAGADKSFNPSAGNGSRYVDYGTLLNAFKMVNMSNRSAGPDGILDAVSYLNTAADFATDNSRPLTPVTIDGRSSAQPKFDKCESCESYGQDGKILEDTSGKGITTENTEKKSITQFHESNQ